MNRRIWTGVIAGVLGAVVLLTVGAGAYRAGQEDDVVTRVVNEGEPGEVVRVVGEHRDFFPGFFLFPLLIILLVVLAFRAFGRGRGWHGGGWHGGWGHGWHPGWHGPYGPGPGPGGSDDPRARWFDEWHRRAHESEGGEVEGGQPPAPPTPTAGEQTARDETPPPTSTI
jgi:hypothetical protein